jgi:flavin reductase (DIM6/NTAB) family NADH-FMN oxidoreductase RutF
MTTEVERLSAAIRDRDRDEAMVRPLTEAEARIIAAAKAWWECQIRTGRDCGPERDAVLATVDAAGQVPTRAQRAVLEAARCLRTTNTRVGLSGDLELRNAVMQLHDAEAPVLARLGEGGCE